MPERPGGALAKRPLHFIWIVDCSGSMSGTKMDSLNYAIKESIKPMRDVSDENPNAEVLVRVVKFADDASWHVSTPTEIHNFKWSDLGTDGATAMGKALLLVSDALKIGNLPRGLPPVLALISDGQPTDDFNKGLATLMNEPWGKKAVRIAIAIGQDADLSVLQKFIGEKSEVKPLVAKNVQDLVNKIRWVSTAVTKEASQPSTAAKGQKNQGNVVIPSPPKDIQTSSAADVF